MDIVVTIPKSESKTIQKEEEWAKQQSGTLYEYWKIGRQPKKLKVGERVYFIENGKITCWSELIGYDEDFTCEATKRFWPGLNLVLKYPTHYLKNSIPTKGFQGFRYIERIEE